MPDGPMGGARRDGVHAQGFGKLVQVRTSYKSSIIRGRRFVGLERCGGRKRNESGNASKRLPSPFTRPATRGRKRSRQGAKVL